MPILLLISVLHLLFPLAPPTIRRPFLAEQKAYPRVREAYATQGATVDSALALLGLERERLHILLAVYKQEAEVEVWAKAPTATTYQLLRRFEICERSGRIGPKRRRGDRQTPEGFYQLDRFNPASEYYLSLGINYPNAADRQRAALGTDLGGDIFIHGDCVTVGCVPITDEGISELYIYAVEARNNGQRRIPAYFFPARLTPANVARLAPLYATTPDLWTALVTGYHTFSATHRELPRDQF
jgi:murein L,D-transpeptidase YafK